MAARLVGHVHKCSVARDTRRDHAGGYRSSRSTYGEARVERTDDQGAQGRSVHGHGRRAHVQGHDRGRRRGRVEWIEGESIPAGQSYTLCRCGRSGRKPFCDGGARTGRGLRRHGDGSARGLHHPGRGHRGSGRSGHRRDWTCCSEARYCAAGQGLWNIVEPATSPEAVGQVVRQANQCSSGPLRGLGRRERHSVRAGPEVLHRADRGPPARRQRRSCGSRGGIPVGGGRIRLRDPQSATLCRCGESENKLRQARTARTRTGSSPPAADCSRYDTAHGT